MENFCPFTKEKCNEKCAWWHEDQKECNILVAAKVMRYFWIKECKRDYEKE